MFVHFWTLDKCSYCHKKKVYRYRVFALQFHFTVILFLYYIVFVFISLYIDRKHRLIITSEPSSSLVCWEGQKTIIVWQKMTIIIMMITWYSKRNDGKKFFVLFLDWNKQSITLIRIFKRSEMLYNCDLCGIRVRKIV